MVSLNDFQDTYFIDMGRLMSEPYYNALRTSGIRGKLMHDRSLMLLKACHILDHSTDSVDFREILSREESINAMVFFNSVNISEWSHLPHGRLYKSKSNWSSSLVRDFPDFSRVTDIAIYDRLGYSSPTPEDSTGLRLLRETDENWQHACEWAIREQEKAFRAMVLEPNRNKRRAATIFSALIFNNLLVSTYSSNRTGERWESLVKSMVTWEEFGRDLDLGNANVLLPSRQSLLSDISIGYHDILRDFYHRYNVYLYNPSTYEVELVRSQSISGGSRIPNFASDRGYYLVRSVLGYAQDEDTKNAKLVGMSVADRNGVTFANLSPDFSSTVYAYTATVGYAIEEVWIIANPVGEADVENTGHTILDVGENVINVRVTSEDQTAFEIYRLTVTRESS